MTDIDTAKAVLAKASLLDQSFATPDLGIAVAWAEALGGADRADALRAVTEHYTTQTRRLMPADVLAGVRRIRDARLRRDFEDVPQLDAVADDPLAYKRELRAHRRRVGSGWVPTAAGLPSRKADLAVMLEDVEKRLPKVPSMDELSS